MSSVANFTKEVAKLIVISVGKDMVKSAILGKKRPLFHCRPFDPSRYIYRPVGAGKDCRNKQGTTLDAEDAEIGNVLSQFITRCDLVKKHGGGACCTYKQAFFMLGEQLTEIRPRCRRRGDEIAKYLVLLESILGMDDDSIASAADEVCRQLEDYLKAS